MTSEFLSVATFVLIFMVMYFVIKIFNMVKNSQETGNERAVAEKQSESESLNSGEGFQ